MSASITTCLWFDTQAEEAAQLYCSLIPGSRVLATTPYADGTERAGQVMTVDFELDGRPYVGLNGGPEYTFNEAVSFQVICADQAEVDHYWEALVADGGEEGPCGWLKDRFGLSWQVVPSVLLDLTKGSDREVAARVTQAMFRMRKLVVADLEAAAEAPDAG